MATLVRVIAAQGATLRGPAVLRLSEQQHRLRAHVLGPWKKGAVAKLDGGDELTFKLGEELTIEGAEGRLNAALFEEILPEKKEKAVVDSNAATVAGQGAVAKPDGEAP